MNENTGMAAVAGWGRAGEENREHDWFDTTSRFVLRNRRGRRPILNPTLPFPGLAPPLARPLIRYEFVEYFDSTAERTRWLSKTRKEFSAAVDAETQR